MRFLRCVFYCSCVLLFLCVDSHAKDWRGLVPLLSTREDVEKLLGAPQPPPGDGTRAYTMHEGRSIYFLDEGEVYIVYTNGKDPKWFDCAGKVPSGTILLIEVTYKKGMALRDLQFNEKRLKKFDPAEPKGIGYEGYLDVEAGIVIRTYKGIVEEVCYIAAAKDQPLCPDYYKNPEGFIHIFVDFFNPSSSNSGPDTMAYTQRLFSYFFQQFSSCLLIV